MLIQVRPTPWVGRPHFGSPGHYLSLDDYLVGPNVGTSVPGLVSRFALICGPLLHVLRRTRSSMTSSVYSSCFLLIPDLCL